MDPILRHIAACNNADLPGNHIPLHVGPHQVGWLAPELLPALHTAGATVDAAVHIDPAQLQPLARSMADAGHFRWRNEAFDVRATPSGPALGQIDRGALPSLGIGAVGVHLNGLVHRADGIWLWVARRAADKQLDPGKLDHLAAGGVPAGLTPRETLVKEAAEEAGLPPSFAAAAIEVGTVDYAMQRPEGLRRDHLVCYDLVLPETFTPEPRDGEVESFELWPIHQVLNRVRTTDDFKFNVPLVLIDLFRRHALLA